MQRSIGHKEPVLWVSKMTTCSVNKRTVSKQTFTSFHGFEEPQTANCGDERLKNPTIIVVLSF